jgi:hypothetical protein
VLIFNTRNRIAICSSPAAFLLLSLRQRAIKGKPPSAVVRPRGTAPPAGSMKSRRRGIEQI